MGGRSFVHLLLSPSCFSHCAPDGVVPGGGFGRDAQPVHLGFPLLGADARHIGSGLRPLRLRRRANGKQQLSGDRAILGTGCR
jgi:hypothetical protein